MIRSVVLGCGGYLPEKKVTNKDLEQIMETSDDWIVERTGIRQRYFAAEGQYTSDLAIEASRQALANAGLDASEIDLVIVGTTTPDRTFPAVATRVQAALGAVPGSPAFDVQAVCSGFLYALGAADSMLRNGMAKNALVIGAETLSRILDFEDRTTAVLFGDGAGAVVLQARESRGGLEDPGVISVHLHADGRYNDILNTDGGVSMTRTAGSVRMLGKEVFRHAVVNLHDVLLETLKANGLTAQDVDWVVPHQANLRIIEGTVKRLGLDMSQVICTIDRHANTSAASVPLALADGMASGLVKPGQLVLLEAMGGGLTWGGALVRL
ncbi:ketoacyl-ACP synthase III [Phaeovibrio sulfidiphilus]|uniref:Beta-ketoacyl-[acyl-carrier-protein] synthase III n=1 Tax=Phaeovibrio sulfidiphilus TaxID=1220600 RepID=A0A8J6YKG1_9PROT|nr:beta-ketoacyl-ACP synthase III [Phaeovibrio sulfidiphilus]MBE1236190.1 ketoacyl-ACP synthase III [Phaeovibrio sulfidiphilus]